MREDKSDPRVLMIFKMKCRAGFKVTRVQTRNKSLFFWPNGKNDEKLLFGINCHTVP